MRLISVKPNAESKLYGVLQSQFACRRNIWLEKPVRHFCAYRKSLKSCQVRGCRAEEFSELAPDFPEISMSLAFQAVPSLPILTAKAGYLLKQEQPGMPVGFPGPIFAALG